MLAESAGAGSEGFKPEISHTLVPKRAGSYMAYESPVLNDRLNTQQGSFLWQEDHFRTLNTDNMIIKIDASSKMAILNELAQIGIHSEGLML